MERKPQATEANLNLTRAWKLKCSKPEIGWENLAPWLHLDLARCIIPSLTLFDAAGETVGKDPWQPGLFHLAVPLRSEQQRELPSETRARCATNHGLLNQSPFSTKARPPSHEVLDVLARS